MQLCEVTYIIKIYNVYIIIISIYSTISYTFPTKYYYYLWACFLLTGTILYYSDNWEKHIFCIDLQWLHDVVGDILCIPTSNGK